MESTIEMALFVQGVTLGRQLSRERTRKQTKRCRSFGVALGIVRRERESFVFPVALHFTEPIFGESLEFVTQRCQWTVQRSLELSLSSFGWHVKHVETFGSVFETEKGFLDHVGTHMTMRTCHVTVLSLFDFVIGQLHRADLPSQYRLGSDLDFAENVLWQATLFSVLQGKVQVYIDIYKGLWFLQFCGMSF